MTEITINGVNIQFPFEPYEVQKDYMKKVIECLQNGKNGVLESPTGTGKTLSLLCSSLAWLMIKKAQLTIQEQSIEVSDPLGKQTSFINKFMNDLNKGGGQALVESESFESTKIQIIYASRTHSQLTQAMRELKRSSYKHVNAVVLGSRSQLCIHPHVLKEKNTFNKIYICRTKIQSNLCLFHNNMKTNPFHSTENVLDIEDLVNYGKKQKLCPYFTAKHLKDNADIIFMPYTYLIDEKIRKLHGIVLKNKILLLDEAHNVNKVCEDSTSIQFSSTDIANCINEITILMKKMFEQSNEEGNSSFSFSLSSDKSESQKKDFTLEDLCDIKSKLLELEKAIDAIEINKQDEGKTFPGDYIFELLDQADINERSCNALSYKLDHVIFYLTSDGCVTNIKKFYDLLQVVYPKSYTTQNEKRNWREKIKESFKMYVEPDPEMSRSQSSWDKPKVTKSTGESSGKLINLWCFYPGFKMQQILNEGVRSIIFTSGTLSPINSFVYEIGIDVAVTLQNSHIITGKQICCGILNNGFDGYCLNASFKTRNDLKYIDSLGNSLFHISSILPQGVLVFFPSYVIMKSFQQQWIKSGIWKKINNFKEIFVEAEFNFNEVVSDYYKKNEDAEGQGAMIMGVCRGKISEGIDFADGNGRAVIIVGLPYPPAKDRRVILKQEYLNESSIAQKANLSGNTWYKHEALRAVNQAVGRIIRHKNDYGAILFFDSRFSNPRVIECLSSWIVPHISQFTNFGFAVKFLTKFFREMHTKIGHPMGLPSVKAELDCGSNRSKTKSETIDHRLHDQIDDFDISFYKTELSEKTNADDVSKTKDFASLLEVKQESFVNLSTCKLQRTSNIFAEPSTDDKPAAKKKKLTLKPIRFDVDASIPSTLSTLSTPSTPSTSTAPKTLDSKSNTCESQFNKLKNDYLEKVKKSLSKDDLIVLIKILQKYTKSEVCFDELLSTLKQLFINTKRTHLLIDFRPFLKKSDLEAFDRYIESMNNSSTR